MSFSPLAMLAFVFIFGMHLIEIRPLNKVKEWYVATPPMLRGVAYGLAVALLVLIVPFSKGTFIYQQF